MNRIIKSTTHGVFLTLCVFSLLFLPISDVLKVTIFIILYCISSYIFRGRSSQSLYEENHQFVSSYYTSKEDLIIKYKNRYYNKQKAKELYLFILNQLLLAVLFGNVNRLRTLCDYIFGITSVENKITLKDFYYNVDNLILDTNLVILACQRNEVTILEYLFKCKILEHLTVAIERNKIRPDDKDETGHNAFYYAMKSGNIELLDTLINKWPLMYFAVHVNELNKILSQNYEELKLKNVPLRKEMEIFVKNELNKIRFFLNTPEQNINNIREWGQWALFVFQNIDSLKAACLKSLTLDKKFFFKVKFYSQSIHMITRMAGFNCNITPCEEIVQTSLENKILTRSYTSKEELIREYNNLYFNKRKTKDLYLKILIELADAILVNDVNSLKKINNFIGYITSVEHNIILKDYYNQIGNPFAKTNLAIFASKYNKVTSLTYLFDNGNKILNNLTVDIGSKRILPDDKDETGHNAFYYAMQSGNIELLDTLINKWPRNYFGIHSSELDKILSQTYEELKLKNIPLSEDIEIFVEKELINLRFFNVPKQNCKSDNNLQIMIEQFRRSLQNIYLIKAECSNSGEADQNVFLTAQNIHLLKPYLNINDFIEQIELYLPKGRSECSNSEEADPNILLISQIVLTYKRFLNINNIMHRIELVLQNIDLLKAEYSNSEEVGQKFLFVAKFIAQNVHILKRQLKSTYNRLPWEEIEFCLICFISSHTTQKEINLFYDFTLDKNKILNHLVNFAKILKNEKDVLGGMDDIDQFTNIPNLKREKVVEEIVSKYPEFKELYSDYQKIRDIYSLEKISSYIKLALSADPKQKDEQLIITRILQIVGEFFKNTLESPKLSSVTSERLLLLLPNNTREVIIDLRNSLSHAYSLFKRDEIENNKDMKFFIGIQNNLNKIHNIIVGMLYNSKIKIIRVLFTKILNSKNLVEIKKVVKLISNVGIESMFTENFKMLEHEKLEKHIKDLSDNIADQTNYEKELFKKIYSIINYSENKSEDARCNLITAIKSLMALTTDLNENNSNYSIRNKKPVATKVLQNILSQLKPQNFKEIANLTMKIYSSAMLRMQSDTLDNISRLTHEIFWIVECSIDDIKWIEELNNKLKEKNYFLPFCEQTNVYNLIEQSYNDQLALKLSELKKILIKNGLNSKLIENFSTYKKNKKLQAIVELLVLDIMSILDRSDKYLENNVLFLDDYTPLLIGKCLRNHLAHDNVLTDVLLFDPLIAIILNAKKLISENIIDCNQKIGKLVIDDPSRLKNKYESSLNTITNQEKMFAALEEGTFEDLKNCLKKGADMNARSINSWTALHYAAKGSSIEIIKYILVQDLSVNDKDVNGQTPLHIAAVHGRETIVDFFLTETDVCVDNLDDFGKSALHFAAKNGHKDTVKVLLKNNASTDTKDIIGFSPLHYAAQNNHIDVVKIMLESDVNVDINETKGGFTLLHIAAENGYLELVNFLLKTVGKVNVKNDDGRIPLHPASMNGHLEVVNALISKGANVNARVIDGCTPLHYAIENGHGNIANILLKHGAHGDAVDKTYNNTVLHYAAKDGHDNIVKALLEYKANASIQTVNGLTPLHFAVRGGHLKIVAALLEYGVNIHTKDKSDASPIYCAAESGHKEMVELLIKNGARINDKTLNYLTPLHVAAAKGHKDITELLIRNGARVTAQDIMGRTPLHSAAHYGKTADIALLINNKAEVDATDYDGLTPLHLAALHGRKSAIVLLIKNKGKINAKNNNGVTPLHMAIMEGHKHIVTLLIKIKSQVNAEENFEVSTPLLTAVEGGHKEIVDILIANGADVNIKSNNNRTPLISAVKHNRKGIVEVLVENGAKVNINNGEPLSHAVDAGYKDIVDILIKNRASIYKKYPANATLLHIAAQRNHKEIVNSLIENGINVDAMTTKRLTALHLAAQDGQEEAASILIANGAVVNVVNLKNQTPLHLAATFGHVNIVEMLLSNGAKIIVKDDENRTPLELAVAHGHLHVVNMLLQHKIVDINSKGNDDWTILHIASQASNLEMVKYLVNRGSNIWARNSSGSLPIHIAAREGYKDIVEFFRSQGLSIYKIGAAGQTLLHYAAVKGQLEVVKYLIAQGAEVNAKDDNGSTPMHIAADIDNKDVIEILLQNGGIYNHIDNLNRRPIEIAKNIDVVRLLELTGNLFLSVMFNSSFRVENSIRTGAFVNAKNYDGRTSLHYAAKNGNEGIVKILLQNKANPNIRDSRGFTALHIAADLSHLKNVKALLSYGATYNIASKRGFTPFDLAIDRDIISLFKLISESFKNVEEDNVHLIYELNEINDIETVKAVMGARNKENKTLVVAAIHDNYSKVEQLKQISQGDISTQIDRGLMLLDQGNYSLALYDFTSIFERRKTILGPDNPGTLDIQLHIATVLYKQGRCQEALTMYEEIFQKQEKILGLNHEDTLSTRSAIALILHRQGKDEESFNIYQEVYQNQTKKLGSNHSDTLNTQFHMALVLEKQGKYEEALNINKTVFDKRKETLGPHNIATISAENNIAMVLASQGKYEESLKLYREVFEKKRMILGIIHTDTLRTLHNIAAVLFSQKKYHEALKAVQKVLNIQKKYLQQNHPETLQIQYNIANLLFTQGKIISALKVFKEIYDQKKAIFGANHPTVLDILNKIETIVLVLKFQDNDVSEVLQHLQTDMNIAANEGNLQTVQRLLNDGADVNDKDVDGRTALHFAVSNGHIDIVSILLQNGADMTQVTKKGNTPLHTATSKGYKEIVNILLKHVSHDEINKFVNAKTTSSGATSLHVAAKNGFLEIVQSLLKHRAIYNIKNKNGEAPIDLSEDQKIINLLKLIEILFRDIKNDNVEAISKLRVAKPDEFLALTNARNDQGNTLLQVAIANKHNSIAGEMLKMLKEF